MIADDRAKAMPAARAESSLSIHSASHTVRPYPFLNPGHKSWSVITPWERKSWAISIGAAQWSYVIGLDPVRYLAVAMRSAGRVYKAIGN